MNQLIPLATARAPELVAVAGARLLPPFEFFTANIRNPNTRRVHARAAST